MVADESWSYPPSYERAGASYPVAPASGYRGLHRHRNPRCILSRTKVRRRSDVLGQRLNLARLSPPTCHGSISHSWPRSMVRTRPIYSAARMLWKTPPKVSASRLISAWTFGSQGLLFRMFYASEIGESFTNVGVLISSLLDRSLHHRHSTAATNVINHPTVAQVLMVQSMRSDQQSIWRGLTRPKHDRPEIATGHSICC